MEKMYIGQEDEWFGNIYICPFCDECDIWSWFKFCPNCGENVEYFERCDEQMEMPVVEEQKQCDVGIIV